jgi:DNA ligase (NAD+)
MKAEIENLRQTISHHNYKYYVLGEREVPDAVYDRMFRKLQELEGKYPEYYDANSPTCRVGSDLLNSFPTVNHLSPMLSVNAVQSQAEVFGFISSADSICELKLDGVGISLVYKDGKLVRAVTRGDGYKGMDVTANIRTIRSVPLKVGTMDEIEVRGEVWCPYSEVKRLQGLGIEVKSPLGVAINSIKTKYSDKCAQRRLRFTAYHLTFGVGGATHQESLDWLKGNNFETPVRFDPTLQVEKIEKICKSTHADIPADGIVYKHDDFDLCESLGNGFRAVNWAISYKFDKEVFPVEVIATGGKVGTGGVVTFQAYFNPITVNNETISKVEYPATALIEEGDTISVVRRGTRVAVMTAYSGKTRSIGNIFCPQCGSLLVMRYTKLFCPSQCQAKPITHLANTYQHSTEINPGMFQVDAGTFQGIANRFGCKLVPCEGNTHDYVLYYNKSHQLADIGYIIGQYTASNS